MFADISYLQFLDENFWVAESDLTSSFLKSELCLTPYAEIELIQTNIFKCMKICCGDGKNDIIILQRKQTN